MGGFSGTQVNFAAGRRWDARADFWDSSGGFGGTMHLILAATLKNDFLKAHGWVWLGLVAKPVEWKK